MPEPGFVGSRLRIHELTMVKRVGAKWRRLVPGGRLFGSIVVDGSPCSLRKRRISQIPERFQKQLRSARQPTLEFIPALMHEQGQFLRRDLREHSPQPVSLRLAAP